MKKIAQKGRQAPDMQPGLLHKAAFSLLGMSFYGDPFLVSGDWEVENEIGRVSQRFGNYFLEKRAQLEALVSSGTFYELHVYGEETEKKGFFEVFVGMETHSPQSAPLDLLVKRLPEASYAVFTLSGSQITSDWYKDLDTILERAGLRRSFPYILQCYDERFKGMDRIDESAIDVYIPVEALA